MCDKCIELDDKIEHYERISVSINDQVTIDRIKKLVEQMKAQKAALHPEREYKAASVGGLFYFGRIVVIGKRQHKVASSLRKLSVKPIHGLVGQFDCGRIAGLNRLAIDAYQQDA
jgi:hypothetical protein